MCVYDMDTYEVFRRSTRRARQPHRCYECSRRIEPGERYERAVGLFDGRWDSMATCPHCVEGRRFLDVVCGGQWLYGDVWGELHGHVDEADCALGASLFFYELIEWYGPDAADAFADHAAQRLDAWSHEGAAIARMYRSAQRQWRDLTPDDAREMAQQAIELWKVVEPA